MKSGPTTWPDHRLTRRVTGFTRFLRAHDFTVGHADTQGMLAVLGKGSLADAATVRRRWKALTVGNRSQWQAFDGLFDRYWLYSDRECFFDRSSVPSAATGTAGSTAGSIPWKPLPDALGGDQQPFEAPDDSGDDSAAPDEGTSSMLPPVGSTDDIDPDDAGTGKLFGSSDDYRRRVDLRHVVNPEEIRAAERQARELAVAIRYRLSRRYEARQRGQQLDLRKTLRANLSHGGEPLTLIRRSPPTKPVRIVVFLDISGSMQHYSRFFLQFIKGLVNEWFDTDAYLFHTRLIRATDVLRDKDAMKSMYRLSQLAEGFGGGTNLARSLKSFNQEYAKVSLTSRTVVFILGDGYDTGGAERLAEQLAQLKRRVRRLVWLNPLLGWENYRPQNASMKAAIPYLDGFAAANTLESLARIEPMLARL